MDQEAERRAKTEGQGANLWAEVKKREAALQAEQRTGEKNDARPTPIDFRAILRTIKVCFWVCFGAFICFGLLIIAVERCALVFAPTSRSGIF
jgi:hypothetical protein